MPHDLPKAYDPAAIEEKWAEYWAKENLFAQPTPSTEANAKQAEGDSPAAQAFTILLPPPNVTGRLHMGHMLNQTEMDILVRWHRMLGETSLWVPGTDHAGIATQMMVEKQVTAEGTTRQALGRDRPSSKPASGSGKRPLRQRHPRPDEAPRRLRRLVSANTSPWTPTSPPPSVKPSRASTTKASSIKGAYIVNWCPGCQTAISDLEVVHEDVVPANSGRSATQ